MAKFSPTFGVRWFWLFLGSEEVSMSFDVYVFCWVLC